MASPATAGAVAKKSGMVWVVLAAIAFLAFQVMQHKDYFLTLVQQTPSKPRVIDPMSFVEFDRRFCAVSTLTDVQKKRDIELIKGKRVRWRGLVDYVSERGVGFRHKATTLTYDVLLTMAAEERSKLVTLNQGDMVEYEGDVDDYGILLPHGLSEGRILSRRSATTDERAKFLMESETGVLKEVLEEGSSRQAEPTPSLEREHDVRKEWPDHGFSSDEAGQKVYDRIRRMYGEE